MTALSGADRRQTPPEAAHWPSSNAALQPAPALETSSSIDRKGLDYLSGTPVQSGPVFIHPEPPPPSTTEILLSIYVEVRELIMEQYKEFEDRLARLPSDTPNTVPFNMLNAYRKAFQDLISEKEDSLAEEICQKAGISPAEFLECVKRAQELNEAFFKDKDPLAYSMFSTSEEELARSELFTSQELQYYYSHLDMEQSVEPIQFTEEQLQHFGITKDEVIETAEKMPCFHYALLLAGEKRAAKNIFTGAPFSLIQLMTLWGWRSVQTPEKGDLVVYLDENDDPLHMGYYEGDGLVRSKLGNLTPYSHLHQTFDISPLYSNRILYLRRPASAVEGLSSSQQYVRSGNTRIPSPQLLASLLKGLF